MDTTKDNVNTFIDRYKMTDVGTGPNRGTFSSSVTAPSSDNKPSGYTYKGQDGNYYNSVTGDPVFDTERYSRDLKQSQNDLENQKEIQRQGLIDAITNKYNANISGIKETGAAEMARTRTMNLRSGLIESPQGSTELGSTEKKTADAIAANEAAKQDEIMKAISDLDNVYYERKRNLTTDKLNELKTAGDIRAASIAERDQRRAPATTILTSLAKNGTTFDQFKLDPSYKNVSKDFTDQELQALFITGANSNTFISDKPEIIGSTAFWFQKQANGTVKKVSLDLGVQDNSIEQVVKTDQGVLVINKDGTYKNIGGANNPTGTEVKTAATQKVASYLNSIANINGIVTPTDYAITKRAWVTDGLASADFDKQFVSYIDAKNLAAYGFDQSTFNDLKKPTTFIINQ